MKLAWLGEKLDSARRCKADAESDTEQAWWAGYECAMREAQDEENREHRAEQEHSQGWVVLRRNRFGAWYVLSDRVYRSRRGAAVAGLVDRKCEVVVPWQGTQEATLTYRSAHNLLPAGQLP